MIIKRIKKDILKLLLALGILLPSANAQAIPRPGIKTTVALVFGLAATGILGSYFGFQSHCGNPPKECIAFAKEFIKNPSVIGAIAPSSPFLADALAEHIPMYTEGISRKILEVGPGTGISTYAILKKMGPLDELHLVELEADLCKILHEKFGADHRVKIHHMSITDFKVTGFDAVVMGIPFNSLPHELVKNIWEQVLTLIKPGATLSYFNYKNLPPIKQFFLQGEEEKDFISTQKYIDSLYEIFGQGYKFVAKNLPEARVRKFKFDCLPQIGEHSV
jgi:phospholipid N-methyltransferase